MEVLPFEAFQDDNSWARESVSVAVSSPTRRSAADSLKQVAPADLKDENTYDSSKENRSADSSLEIPSGKKKLAQVLPAETASSPRGETNMPSRIMEPVSVAPNNHNIQQHPIDLSKLHIPGRFEFLYDIKMTFLKIWKKYPLVKSFVLWVTWIVSGTVFYAYENRLGWRRGFYMMVNVGYSIGWGFPREINYECMWYSVFNVLIGKVASKLVLYLQIMRLEFRSNCFIVCAQSLCCEHNRKIKKLVRESLI
jgi:hypothetical protein